MRLNHQLVERARLRLSSSIDWEAKFYEGQKPVESWALDAIDAALRGDNDEAKRLLDRYENALWDTGEFPRSEYVSFDEHFCMTKGCMEAMDDGEGYDGYCGNCADKRERRGVYDG
jgi:hypothetical protein